jgi:hypothetical protein
VRWWGNIQTNSQTQILVYASMFVLFVARWEFEVGEVCIKSITCTMWLPYMALAFVKEQLPVKTLVSQTISCALRP